MERRPSFDRQLDDVAYEEEFLQIMKFPEGSLESAQSLMSRFQINNFLKSMHLGKTSIKEKKSRSLMKFRKSSKSRKHSGVFTVLDMFSFQTEPIFSPMLRLEDNLHETAIKIFTEILKYMGLEEGVPLEKEESIAIIIRLYNLLHKHPPLRDEIFMQLEKQTRNNPYKGSCLKAWELMRFCAAAYPPSKRYTIHLSEYFVHITKDEELNTNCRDFILSSWSFLDRAIKGGYRKTQPAAEEIDAMMSSKRMMTNVFMYDDSSEELGYDITTTVAEALKELNSKLKLQNGGSFGLFECKTTKKPGSLPNEDPTVEHIRLESSRFIGDIVSEFRSSGWGGYVSCRLLLKRRVFRTTEEGITEPIFMHLSYLQLCHDYKAGHYWVPSDLAAQIAALLLLAKFGCSRASIITEEWIEELKQNWPLRLRPRANVDFRNDVLARCRALGLVSKEDAVQQVVRTILALPGGGSTFFPAKTAVDSSKFFPEKVIMGVCSRGIQFLKSTTNDLLLSASLRDIEEYAANRDRIYFRLVLRDKPTTVEFDTNQGPEICTLLDIHIKDALRLQSKGSSPYSN